MSSISKSTKFASRLRANPTGPGVYLMRDSGNTVIYVGKSTNLQQRIRSYFQNPLSKPRKIQHMIHKIADYEYMVTETETEALILENTLIKKYKPFYNARLKDDKSYPYIKITVNEDFPQVLFTRRVVRDGARYFGPFTNVGAVRKTMGLLNKLFPYRSCSKPITGNDPRPCLEYYIDRCTAPCAGYSDRNAYMKIIAQVVWFLEGNVDPILRELYSSMSIASADQQFEKAGALRDQIRAIESINESQIISSAQRNDEDAIGIASDGDEAWVELFSIRNGKLVGRDHFIMEGQNDEPSTLIQGFIQQFYETTPSIPPRLLIQHPIPDRTLLESWLTDARPGKVQIVVPQRGEKLKLIKMVAENAKQGLLQKRARWLSETDKVLQARIELVEALGLPSLLERIECYDISNIQGTNPVGSMVVFEEGKQNPSQYRRFQIRDVKGVDDYSMMREMLKRRFKRLTDIRDLNQNQQHPIDRSDGPVDQEGNDLRIGTGWGSVPSLVLIDGGKGHLSAAQQVFLELGISDIPLASIAKQNEEIFVPQNADSIRLPKGSQSLYLVQRIRDEAHRFAIQYHRHRRSKVMTRSTLDSIHGVGPEKKRMLLRHFGSADKIALASAVELASLPNIGTELAERIKSYLARQTILG